MTRAAGAKNWSHSGAVLIVDDDEVIRTLVHNQIVRAGGECYAVESHDAAIQVCESNLDVRYLVLDHGIAGGNLSHIVRTLRGSRPDIVIVGSSGGDSRDEFRGVGVRRYLQKPWSLSELTALLPQRLGTCVECGMLLPLRRPAQGELAKSWVCCGCSARYRGVLDAEFPIDVRRNAREVAPR